MQVSEAVHQRRSVKAYEDRPVSREEVEALLEAARWAPNHRMTEPWSFYVLGPDTQRVYAEVRATLKSEVVEEPEAARAVREKVERESMEIPRMVAVASDVAEDPEIREEDFAAVWMGVQNLLLTAWEMGIGGYIRTGAILDQPLLRKALGIPEGQRILAFVQLGRPASIPDPKPRSPVAERTRWLD